MGVLLVQMRMPPDEALADRIFDRIKVNSSLPVVELMWGLPGSMLACVFMRQLVDQPRFESLFQAQAERLLMEAEEVGGGVIWTQDLYGQRVRCLSAVHGFAGNVLALVKGWDWLSAGQRALLAERVPGTLAMSAVRTPGGINWPAVLPHSGPVELCQHCHGAPGIVTAIADAPFSSPTFDRLLIKGGEHIWSAGALRKGANLCHGTAWNGYAFLKLFARTGNPLWLDRARAFAMVAMEQVKAARASLGRGRYSLWTGDIGTALYFRACIVGDASFPTIDVL
ncbi:lanthionine synthetase C family protein [Methylobacterium sp. D54C]